MPKKMYAPNKEYTGISAGVPFVNGVGETSDPHLISWFKRSGYEVEEPEPEPEQEQEEGQDEPPKPEPVPEPAPVPKKTAKKTGD